MYIELIPIEKTKSYEYKLFHHLVHISKVENEIFDRLLQVYEYEFSDLTDLQPDELGVFHNKELEASIKEGLCQPYLLRFNHDWAGISVVNLRSYLTADPSIRDMGEFFVLKNLRGQKLGETMACHLFNLYPGKWEIRQLPGAKKAHAFWIKVINTFTNGDFSDEYVECSKWTGYLQKFKS